MAADIPNSYKDPYWAQLASAAGEKVGLPPGLLPAIISRGERSNNDQVSEAGARTPFQIIPSTRKLALDKWGIDANLSPENAAEVAGLLLKDSLDRNKGDAKLAVAEYHGGTDRSNWGPRTRAYVQRVTGSPIDAEAAPVAPAAAGAPPSTDAPGFAAPAQSTFDRVSAAMAKPTEPQIASIYAAYQSGQMSPQDAKQFESDVQAGHIMLPRGAALKTAAPDAGAAPGAAAPAGGSPAGGVLPQAVMDAYASGKMSTADRMQLEKDVEAGLVQVPQGATLNKTQAPGIIDRVKESITGAERATPQTDALPDWATMPELNSLSMASAKTGLGTLLSNPQETAQIIKANFPDAQVRQDEKGNYLIRSAANGQEYAIKPGFSVSDIPRALGALAAFTPAGRATTVVGAGAGAAATQAAIEASQAATGGKFDPKEVAIAGAGGAIVPGVVNAVRAAAEPAANLLARVRGVPEPVPAAPAAADAVVPAAAPSVPAVPAPGAAPVAAAPAAPAAALTGDELGQTLRDAALGGLGSKKATQVLAQQAAPDAETVAAAKRLGVEDYLQPDHVTTNQAYRQLAQLVKSQTGSEAAVLQRSGLEKVAERANGLIDEIGGTADASTLSSTVRARMEATQRELSDKADDLYNQVRDAVPAKTGAPARNVLSFVEQRAKDLGGAENLSPMEKQILSKLSPKDATGGKVQPTYTLLDDVRKDLGAAARAAGPFKDADTGLAKKLYQLLSNDQAAVVQRLGVSDVYDAARQAVAVRKGLEDDMASLFGKRLDQSLAPVMSGAVKKMGQGDTSAFLKMIGSIPAEMRPQVTASGLSSFFQRTARGGEMDFAGYSKWFDALERNQQAKNALFSNLPPEAAKQLTDLARVSRGIAMAKGEFLATGKAINPDVLKAADSMMGKVFDEVRRRGIGGIVAEVAGTSAGAPGLASALQSATMASKPSIAKAADRLITSPEFIAAARAAGTPQQAAAARAFAYSKPFTRFVRAVGQPRELSNRERWVMQALQADNQTRR